jgi:hypothetical protein
MDLILNRRIMRYLQKYNDANQILFKNTVDMIKDCKENYENNVTNYMKMVDTKIYFYDIIKYGYFSLFRYINKCYPDLWLFSTDEMDIAAQYGYLYIVIWLHKNHTEGCTTKAMDYAARNNHLDVVIWLHNNRKEGCSVSAMDYASAFGYLDIVIWLHNNRKEGCTFIAMDYAAENGHLNVIKWLNTNRTEGCSVMASYKAKQNNHDEVVAFLNDIDVVVSF